VNSVVVRTKIFTERHQESAHLMDKQRVMKWMDRHRHTPVTHVAVIVWMARPAWTPAAPDRGLAEERCVWLSLPLFESRQLWC